MKRDSQLAIVMRVWRSTLYSAAKRVKSGSRLTGAAIDVGVTEGGTGVGVIGGRVGEGVGLGVGVADGVGEGVGVAVGIGEGDGVGVGK